MMAVVAGAGEEKSLAHQQLAGLLGPTGGPSRILLPGPQGQQMKATIQYQQPIISQ